LTALSGSEFTSVLLGVVAERADSVEPAEVLRRHRDDRFVASGSIDLRSLHRMETRLLETVPASFDGVVLAPLAPTGLHSSVAEVHQNNVVATIRRTDVAADPTAGLALEAAVRRRPVEHRSGEPTRLVGLQRVTRAQMFDGPRSFAHFTLLGLVTAGRDTGNHRFERDALVEHGSVLALALLASGADEVRLKVSDWTGMLGDVVDRITGAVGDDRVVVEADPGRTRAKGYYRDAAVEGWVRFGDDVFDVADGGFVDWTARLLEDAKERLMISGIGVDRLVLAGG
jgi:hypothetical protein